MKTTLSVIALCLLLSFTTATAQQQQQIPVDTAWTLKQCIDYAWTYSLFVKRSEFDVEDSKLTLTQAQLSRLPSINGQASYGYSWGRGLDPVTNQFTTQQIRSSGVGASGSLPLIGGLNLHNTIRQSVQSFEASKLDLTKTKNDVALNVASLFIDVVFSKEQLANAKLQLASSEQQLDRTHKQVAAGSLARSEELNLDAQVATNELTVVQQENILVQAILKLKQALQIPAVQVFDVTVPDLDPEDLILNESRDQIYDIARQAMPEIKSANLRVESAYYGVKAAHGNFYPMLSLEGYIQTNYSSTSESKFVSDGGSVTYPVGIVPSTGEQVITTGSSGTFQYYGLGGQFKDNIYRTLSLQLSIPIFNAYRTRTSYQRARITRGRALVTQQETDNTLRQNIETSFNDALAASKTYNASLRQVKARDEAFRITRQLFENGGANSVDYQVSENDLFRSKSDLARAKYNFIFKKKVLDFYQGKPLAY